MAKSKLSTSTATITTIISMFGAGINFMPSAFESIGYLTAIGVMTLMIILTFFTLYAVAFAASTQKDSEDMTYSSIAYNKSRVLGLGVDGTLIFTMFLVGVAFFKYIVGVTVLFLTGKKPGDDYYNLSRLIIISVIGLLFYGLALLKDLSSLRHTSYAGVASVVYLFLLMPFFSFYLKGNVCDGELKATNSDYYSGLPKIILAMACQTNMVKVYSEMSDKTTFSIIIVSLISAIFGGFVYASVGFFGYRTLGDSVYKQDLINVFANTDSKLNQYLKAEHPNLILLPKIAIVGAIIVLVGSFPLQLNPLIVTLVKLFGNERNAGKVRFASATVICGAIVGINLFPNLSLDVILSITGAICCNALSLFFPPLYYLISAKRFGLISLLSVAVMAFSVIVGAYILYNVIKIDILG